jgi:hypothetical protein
MIRLMDANRDGRIGWGEFERFTMKVGPWWGPGGRGLCLKRCKKGPRPHGGGGGGALSGLRLAAPRRRLARPDAAPPPLPPAYLGVCRG